MIGSTLTVFHFPRGVRGWGAAQFALAPPLLAGAPGLRFWKLMGTGRGPSFSIEPDWSRQALFAVWESLDDARRFHERSRFIRRYERRILRSSTLYLQTLAAHGAWGGGNPFLPIAEAMAAESASAHPIAVLTRASLRPRHLPAFWRSAREVNARLVGADGLLGSIGIGEAPYIRQGTFSLWRDAAAINAFAYRMEEHRDAIHRSRAGGWYSEELFARFAALEVVGEFP